MKMMNKLLALKNKFGSLVSTTGVVALLILFQTQAQAQVITFEAVTTSSNGKNTSITIAFPGGAVVGDYALLSIAARDNPDVTENTTTDWTGLIDADNGDNAGLTVFHRIVDGTEAANYTFDLDANKEAAASIELYRSVDTTNPGDRGG